MEQEREVEHRLIDPELPHHAENQSKRGNDSHRDDEIRRKPIVFLTLVEHNLQAAEAQRAKKKDLKRLSEWLKLREQAMRNKQNDD